MNHSQRGVAVFHVIGDDAYRQQIENLIGRDSLLLQFLMDGIEPLDSRFGEARNVVLLHFVFDDLGDLCQKRFMRPTLSIDDFFEFLVCLRIDVAECEILELATDFAHAEAVRQRRVDFHGLAGDGLAAVCRKIGKRPHIVEPVGKLDHNDPDVVGHGKEHLTEILGLLRFFGGELDLTDLGHSIDDVSHVRPEKLFDLLQ